MSNRTVLLMNFGGPRCRSDIAPFLRSLTGSAPRPTFMEGVIGRYAAIGGCSPLPAITEELAHLLTSRLDLQNGADVRAVFRHSHPTVAEGIEECRLSGVTKIAFFVLSPFYNAKTTRAYIDAAEDCLTRFVDYKPDTIFIHSWFAQPLFIEWWVKKVQRAAELSRDAVFLFSAHSMPSSEEHDLYRAQVEETIRAVAKKAALASYELAWQSAPSRCEEEWMKPSVELALDSLAHGQARKVIQIPIGFLIDNLETLYDIDIVHKRYAEKLGIEHHRLACPNTDPAFVQVLSALLSDSLKEFH